MFFTKKVDHKLLEIREEIRLLDIRSAIQILNIYITDHNTKKDIINALLTINDRDKISFVGLAISDKKVID